MERINKVLMSQQQKQKWLKPELLILTRDQQESVLTSCKNWNSGSGPMSGNISCTKGTSPHVCCDADNLVYCNPQCPSGTEGDYNISCTYGNCSGSPWPERVDSCTRRCSCNAISNS